MACNKRLGLLAVLLILVAAPAPAQIQEVPLGQRIDSAELIVEGTVLRSTAFWGPGETQIFTAHRIRVARVLKHGVQDPTALTEIDLITPGGQIDNRLHVVTPSLHPRVGATGLFFLEQRDGYAGRDSAWVPSASVQGFVRYRNGAALDSFRVYSNPTREIFEPIARRTGQGAVVLDLQAPVTGAVIQGGPTITGFSPGTVRGGIQELLTINGFGFGTLTGVASILFDDADDGLFGISGAADPEHIIAWSDTQIQVLIPNRNLGPTAGTGRLIVRTSTGSLAQSAADLIVQYALTEILSGGSLFRLSLENEDQRGGYTFRYSTSTANVGVDFTSVPDAVARFEESVAAWNCAAGWSGTVDGTTTVQAVGNDGINIVSFDHNADLLPGGVLGRTSSFFSGCGGDTWHLDGVDLRFRRNGTGGVAWYYGVDPAGQAGSEHDFASVALHELGHAVQHGHINDTADSMYYAISSGADNRNISAAGIAGGQDIVSYSAPFASCGDTGTLSFDCAAAPTAKFLADPLGTCGTGLSVDFTDTSLNGPTSWNWIFGDTGVSGLRNPSHSYTSVGLYTVSLTTTNGNGADTVIKDNVIVVTSAPAAPSCNPTFFGHDNCCSIGIHNVTLNTIDNSTASNTQGDPLEEDFTCSQLTVLETGTTHPISVTTGPANAEDVRVYIDWNNDGALTAGELAFSSDNATSHSGNISIPGNAVKNTALRMRVLSDFFPIFSACENIEFGQVENYSVIVVDPPPAVPGKTPATLALIKNATLRTDLDLTWDASCGAGATDYSVHEGTIGTWYSHTSVAACTTGAATSLTGFTPQAGSRYYLVVPLTASAEGSYGSDSGLIERPVSTAVCRPLQDLGTCP